MSRFVYSSLGLIFCLSGCAHFDFSDNGKGVVYYDPAPYLFVSTSYSEQEKVCKSTATVIMMPGQKRVIAPVVGVFGSSNLSAKFDKGFITEFGQSGDSKAAETLDSIAGLLPALAGAGLMSAPGSSQRPKPTKTDCPVSAVMYPINNGIPDLSHPIDFAVTQPLPPAKNGDSKQQILDQ
ncbi:hypothetical protein [Lelliottia amnigena]|uniref:hypothetical protein n=1 Tax=Lelliottia amnigena TaxID=61646 RepID=UPI000FB83EBF|nr:hypothetical protein [Lelliottia amnigena]MBM7357394.1 hypothetical protein [Lelliottia amnigena]WSO19612.1 hypothetical protein VUJ45_21640 [Lelliottia amnigena]